MDPITSILNTRCENIIDRIEFKKGAFSKNSKPFIMKNVKISFDDDYNIILNDGTHRVELPELGIVYWDYECGIEHQIESGYKKIGIVYTKENMFK